MNKVQVGDIAICGEGSLGLVTNVAEDNICYGIHLTDVISKIGSPWQSQQPTVVSNFNKTLMTCLFGLLMRNNKKPGSLSPEENQRIQRAMKKLKDFIDD